MGSSDRLRERGGDVLLLAKHFLQRFCEKKKRVPLELSSVATKVLSAYPWPGNVRELENFMERLSILVDGDAVQLDDLPRKILDAVGGVDALPDVGAIEEIAPEIPLSSVAQDPPIAMISPMSFAWPTLAELERLGLGLKEVLDAI